MDTWGKATPLPYQSVLRVIGRELDAWNGRCVTILELPARFSLRYQVTDDPMSTVVQSVQHAWLAEQVRELHTAAHPPQHGIHRGKAQVAARTYQDVLRALGYELEALQAYSVALDEMPNGFLVTYQNFTAESGYLPQKHMALLDQGMLSTLRDDARRRRQPESARGWGRFRRSRGE